MQKHYPLVIKPSFGLRNTIINENDGKDIDNFTPRDQLNVLQSYMSREELKARLTQQKLKIRNALGNLKSNIEHPYRQLGWMGGNPFISFGQFNPLSVAGCKLWLKADAGITKDGGNLVSNWADQSGQGNDVAQATGTNQPLWVDSAYASKPTIRFDGVDNKMEKATFSGGAIAQTNFIFMVSTFPDTDGRYAFNSVAAEPNRHALLHSPSTNYDVYAGTELTGGTVTTTLQQLTIKYAGSSSYLRKNGTQIISGDAGTGGMNGLRLAAGAGGGEYGLIDISEMLIYNASLSDADRDAIENYLKSRWGL